MSHPAAPTILVVDDEEQIRAIVAYVLTIKGYRCLEAASAEDAWTIFSAKHVDAIILDVMLPGASGTQLCSRIRTQSQVPILLLSALADEDSRIAGLEAGADDYVTKPFSPKEVGLRIDALLRRIQVRTAIPQVAGVNVDPLTHELIVGSAKTQLPTTEAKVLGVLLTHAPHTISVAQLLNDVWNTSQLVGGVEMVRITVHRLRQHLSHAGAPADFVMTVRGEGYKINPSLMTHN